MALVRDLTPILSRLHGPDRGTARLSHSHAKSRQCYYGQLIRQPIVAIIKGEECESSYSDGGVSIAEPSTSAMEQVYIDCNYM